jgi:diguanylate cyclase (GGDEF)-like protein/PAS domain S-box-containing protein
VSGVMIRIVLIEDGKLVYSNERFGTMFGYSDDEIRELTPMDLAVESDRAVIAENIRKRMSGEVAVLEYPFGGLRKDRSLVDVECHSSVLRIGRRTLSVSLLMDVTLRKQAEREVRALQDQLREQSVHDSLTGLYNRRYLDEFFDRELTRADRAGHPITVIMGDLDHFKGVNDSYGHLAGDEVLRRFASLMRRNSRSTDICCRYGGEEFLLVLPGVPQAAGVERAEKLRQVIEATPVRHDSSLIAVTSSFGVASFPHDGRTADDVIAAADSALYAAKTRGRNQVATFEPPRIGIDQASASGVVDTPIRARRRPMPPCSTGRTESFVGGRNEVEQCLPLSLRHCRFALHLGSCVNRR